MHNNALKSALKDHKYLVAIEATRTTRKRIQLNKYFSISFQGIKLNFLDNAGCKNSADSLLQHLMHCGSSIIIKNMTLEQMFIQGEETIRLERFARVLTNFI